MPMAIYSQLPDDFPAITAEDMPGAVISSPRVFTGSSLFGYMNGGAELYLEYGFSLASITEITFMGGKYKTEIFRMKGPEEAFGIFSVSKFKCLDMPPYAAFTCRTRYQLQICKGPYYISIINSSGTVADSTASAQIGGLLAARIADGELNLPEYLPGIPEESIKTSCFLAKGRLGIVNGDPDLEDSFKGIQNYTSVILKGDEKYTISVKFGDSESMKKFIEVNGIEVTGTKEAADDSKLPEFLSDNHILFEKTR
ncbi:MAG: hypothetical protein JXR67_11750 [Bacteroidales bacterium]|nr:hypothetical protein [Bacteroidales bacterium]